MLLLCIERGSQVLVSDPLNSFFMPSRRYCCRTEVETLTERRSPSVTRSSGPGTMPLYAATLTVRPGRTVQATLRISRETDLADAATAGV